MAGNAKKEVSEAQLPPLPMADPPPALLPSLAAASIRSLLQASSVLFLQATRQLLQFMFASPLKYFRPSALKPYAIFNELSSASNSVGGAGLKFMYNTTRMEGGGGGAFLARNILPLVILNSIVGAILFNGYTLTLFILKSTSLSTSSMPSWSSSRPVALEVPQSLLPFIAGGVAGSLHSFLSHPLQRFQHALPGNSHAAHKNVGVMKLYWETLKHGIPPINRKLNLSSSPPTFLTKTAYLYQGLGFTLTRDTLAFSIFFGIFENFNGQGGRWLLKVNPSPPPSSLSFDEDARSLEGRQASYRALAKAGSTLLSGGLAGAAYQAFVYPVDRFYGRIREVKRAYYLEHHNLPQTHHVGRVKHTTSHIRLSTPSAISLLLKGTFSSSTPLVSYLFTGISSSLMRSVPASAVGLFVYQITSPGE